MIYAFGDFELDEALLELRFRGCAELVPPRVLRALLHLIRNRARAVSRDELLQAVWGGVAVSDTALSQTIRLARRASHDEGDQQRVIKTVRGHGFRFVAQVAERPSAEHALRAHPSSPATCSELIGRDRELAELDALLTRAERGQGSLVFLHGEPGIGKTSLAEELCARASARGANVFWGRCWEEGGAPAFWPFVQVLRAMSARFGPETLRSWLDADCAELLRLVPELAPASRADATAPGWEGPHVRFRVFDGMARVLKRMAQGLHPSGSSHHEATAAAVVITLDDLHAADDASLQLLRFLSPELRDAPLLVLGTFRDVEVTPQSALATLLGGPLENTRRVALRGLERLDVARLAEKLGGHSVSEPTLQQLHELSGGNPFLVGELARFSAHELELSALSVLRMPERMVRAVRRRLEELPAATRAALEVAAALGREFSLAALCTAHGCTELALLTDLDPALRDGMLEPVPGSAGARVRFSHALVRDALYGALAVARRVAMHRRIAESLEASQPREQQPLYELAHHFYLAAPAGVAPKAIEYALRAAAHAEEVFAFDSAGSLRDRAIELSSTLAEPVSGDLLIAAGHAWYRAGELVKAAARYQRAAERARADNDVSRLAYAVVSYTKVRRGFAMFDAQLLELIRATLAAFGPGDHVLKAMLLGFRSLGLNGVGSPADREASTREAVEMARRLKDDGALVVALGARRWLMAGVLHPSQTRQIATELIELARRSEHRQALLEGLFWRLQDQLELGDRALAERDFAEYSALADSQRHMAHRYWALLFEAARQTWSGQLARAEELSGLALSLGQRIREPMAVAVHALQLWGLHVLQGTTEQQPDPCAALGPLAHWHVGRAWCLLVRISQERREDARQLYEGLAKHDFADLASDPFRRALLACVSAGCVFLDDRARAPRLYQLLSPDADLHVAGQTGMIAGPVSQFLARLALCMRDYERAASHFEHALEQCVKLEARAQLAAIQHEYAHTLRHIPRGRAGLATRLLAEADRAGKELGLSRRWPLAPALSA